MQSVLEYEVGHLLDHLRCALMSYTRRNIDLLDSLGSHIETVYKLLGVNERNERVFSTREHEHFLAQEGI